MVGRQWADLSLACHVKLLRRQVVHAACRQSHAGNCKALTESWPRLHRGLVCHHSMCLRVGSPMTGRLSSGVPGAHAAQERAPAQLQSNLIAYSSHRQEVKEWHYYPDSSAASRPRDAPLEEGVQLGPSPLLDVLACKLGSGCGLGRDMIMKGGEPFAFSPTACRRPGWAIEQGRDQAGMCKGEADNRHPVLGCWYDASSAPGLNPGAAVACVLSFW